MASILHEPFPSTSKIHQPRHWPDTSPSCPLPRPTGSSWCPGPVNRPTLAHALPRRRSSPRAPSIRKSTTHVLFTRGHVRLCQDGVLASLTIFFPQGPPSTQNSSIRRRPTTGSAPTSHYGLHLQQRQRRCSPMRAAFINAIWHSVTAHLTAHSLR